MAETQYENQKLLFVTGRLAESGLRGVVGQLAADLHFEYQIAVPGIQVAALLHVNLLLNRLVVESDIDRVILPGWVQGDLSKLEAHFGRPFERGPRNFNDLPRYMTGQDYGATPLESYSIDIIAEINHATHMPLEDVVAVARQLSQDGADLIDVGCLPGESSPRVFEIVSALRQQGLRVSIDSFDQREVEQAVDAGAELILSCNHSNLDWVTRLGMEVVAIPDSPEDVQSLDSLIERLTAENCAFRIDPILEPIGMGFTSSLERYINVRRRYPDAAMMMGVGNVTEMTEVDSAGTNMLLAAVCEELGIQSILTTQVINWCRSAVAEFDVARRLVHHSVSSRVVPKHLDSSLVMLRDPRLKPQSEQSIQDLANALTDANFRIFAEQSGLHLMNRHGHWHGSQPFQVFADALSSNPDIDASHAFYLGYEMARAELARLLGKQYSQDEPMPFGIAGELPGSGSAHHDQSSS